MQYIQDLSDNTQQHSLHSLEENALLFIDNTMTLCDFNITNQHSVTEKANNTNIPCAPKQSGIHSQCKHTYRNTFGKSNIQYHDFDNHDSLTFIDKYSALLQQELQNPYWNLHDPITPLSFCICALKSLSVLSCIFRAAAASTVVCCCAPRTNWT